jgi:hypothetical protein
MAALEAPNRCLNRYTKRFAIGALPADGDKSVQRGPAECVYIAWSVFAATLPNANSPPPE